MSKTSPLAPKNGFPVIKSISGVQFSDEAAGIKYSDRSDVMLAYICQGSSMAGIFTKSATRSAAVLDCQNKLNSTKKSEGPFAIVVNSGNSNAFTGMAGFLAVENICSKFSTILKIRAENIYTASTGVIGEPLNWQKIVNVASSLKKNLSSAGIEGAANAIMTTDTFAKGSFKEFKIDKDLIKIGGIAKGSGMIAPDMATMLVYIFTDARIEQALLEAVVSELNEETFNSITVDGDTSTSDSLMVVATCKSGPLIMNKNSTELKVFKEELKKVMRDLAHQVVKDGEGATKFIEVEVIGGSSYASSRKVAKSIANSPLVKTAVAGEDPNWGRIIMAIGKSGADVKRDLLKIKFGDILVAEDGWVCPHYSEEMGATYMQGDEIKIHVDLGLGNHKSTFWTCDLTHQYISINADYRS